MLCMFAWCGCGLVMVLPGCCQGVENVPSSPRLQGGRGVRRGPQNVKTLAIGSFALFEDQGLPAHDRELCGSYLPA